MVTVTDIGRSQGIFVLPTQEKWAMKSVSGLWSCKAPCRTRHYVLSAAGIMELRACMMQAIRPALFIINSDL